MEFPPPPPPPPPALQIIDFHLSSTMLMVGTQAGWQQVIIVGKFTSPKSVEDKNKSKDNQQINPLTLGVSRVIGKNLKLKLSERITA